MRIWQLRDDVFYPPLPEHCRPIFDWMLWKITRQAKLAGVVHMQHFEEIDGIIRPAATLPESDQPPPDIAVIAGKAGARAIWRHGAPAVEGVRPVAGKLAATATAI